jgi:predicted XRE-type DNA-binding protein
MERQTFDNVFEASMDTPEDVANLTVRSDLMRAVRKTVESWSLART